MSYRPDACEAEKVLWALKFAPIDFEVNKDFTKCKYVINFPSPVKSLNNTMTTVISNGMIRLHPDQTPIEQIVPDNQWVKQCIDDFALNVWMTLMCMMRNALNIARGSYEEMVIQDMAQQIASPYEIAKRFTVKQADEVKGL